MTSRKGELHAILFDLDDTLFSTSDFAERARRNAVQGMVLHGLRMPPEDALKELHEVIGEFTSNYPSHFNKLLLRIPPDRFAGVNPAIIVAAGVIAYHETKSEELRPFDDVIRALERLSKTHLLLGIISAGLEIKQAEKILRLGIYPYLDPRGIFISDQIGISKPNVKLYQMACDQLELDPRHVMYVGDNPTQDIDPCNRLGMITVRSRRDTRLRDAEGKTKPDYEIDSFDTLVQILIDDFELQV